MGLRILLADPRDLVRQSLHTLFVTIRGVHTVDEVDTCKTLKQYLTTHQQIDLAIVHQSLITDFALLPGGQFVVLADTLDQVKLFAAFEAGAKGYLSENASQELLLATLKIAQKKGESAFLVDPSITPTLLVCVKATMISSTNIDTLTSRERAVLLCLHRGLTDAEIAKELCITPATVRSHIAHILHKLHITRGQIKYIPLPNEGT